MPERERRGRDERVQDETPHPLSWSERVERPILALQRGCGNALHDMTRVFSMLRRLSAFAIVSFGLVGPALAQEAADVIVRLSRLENQMRQLSGQVEQLQFENRQLKEQLRKFQEDVEYRFQEGRGAAPRQAAPSATPSQLPSAATPVRPAQPPAPLPQ